MVVLLALRVRQSKQLLQQKRVLEDPLDGLDEVRLESGRVLPSRVLGVQERLEGWVRPGWESLNTAVRGEVRETPSHRSAHLLQGAFPRGSAEHGVREEGGRGSTQGQLKGLSVRLLCLFIRGSNRV